MCLSVFNLGVLTSCSDDDYTPGPQAEGAGIYFSSSQSANITLDETDGTFSLDVYRSNVTDNNQAELTVSLGEGAAGLFTVPTTVTFKEGQNKTTLVVSYQNLERDVEYQVSIAAKESTPYAVSSQSFIVVCPLIWNVVSENATLIDNMFEPFGRAGIPLEGIKLEKHPEKNLYRFLCPYTNEYLNGLFGTPVIPDGFETPYVYLDGETYPGFYFVPMVKTGWKMVNGKGPAADVEWDTFGSVYGNFQVEQTKYPLGTYDEDSKTFDLGKLVHMIDNDGKPMTYVMNAKTLLQVNN